MFAIVKFFSGEEEEVAVAPLKWIRSNRCFWPPSHLRHKIMMSLDKAIDPSETWNSYYVEIMGIYETYAAARAKLPTAESKSDLNSTDIDNCGRGKRMKKKRRLSISSSESEELHVQSQPIHGLKKRKKVLSSIHSQQIGSERISRELKDPPTFIQTKDSDISHEKAPNDDSFTLSSMTNCEVLFQSVSLDEPFTFSTEPDNENSNQPGLPYENSEIPPTPPANNENVQRSGLSYQNLEIIQTPPATNRNVQHSGRLYQDLKIIQTPPANPGNMQRSESLFRSESPSLLDDLQLNSSEPLLNSQRRQLVKKKHSSSTSGTTGFETSVLREINLLKMKVNTIAEKLDCIINYMNAHETLEKADRNVARDMKDVIPVQSFADLDQLEVKLKDENFFNQMIHFLNKLGGYNCEQATKLMLKRVMSDEMAVSFSYQGVRDKRAFKALQICKVLLCAVRTHVLWNESSEACVEKTISNWLRHAKARLCNKKNLK